MKRMFSWIQIRCLTWPVKNIPVLTLKKLLCGFSSLSGFIVLL
uniref:Uncharacterized protein n=1 Tax=Anguilla anguilla TaxID=7936 RepID=A0A0E9PME3_ANGAN